MAALHDDGGGGGMGHDHSHSHEHGDHSSEVVALGTVTFSSGAIFAVDREGECQAGKAITFGVERVGDSEGVPSVAWVEDADSTRLCDAVEGDGHGQHWHFTVTPADGSVPAVFAMRLGDETGTIELAAGALPRHDGILTPLLRAGDDRALAGFLELKLHDDAGDLELWLSSPVGGGTEPLDVPADTTVCVSFLSHDGVEVELTIRNADQNEDEDGTPTMRDGSTNYFIFPGETGADPTWLMGLEWRGVVQVDFASGGVAYTCDPFVLVPHSAL